MSNKLFRMALEDGEEASGQNDIVMKGPLAEIYAKALDVVYAKPDTVTDEVVFGGDKAPAESSAEQKEEGADAAVDSGGVKATDQTGTEIIAQETQANDALTAQHIAAQQAPKEEAPSAEVTIYGVTASDVNDATVAEVTKQITEKKEGTEYVLILDATGPGPNGDASSAPVEKIVDLNKALETVATCLGAKVYPSLESYCEASGRTMKSPAAA